MDFSQIKLIVTDMDGTLLNDQHEVSDEFYELHRKLTQKGFRFIVASGRQYYSLKERMKPIQNELTYIAENGAIVIENEEEIFLRAMETDIVHELIRKVREMGPDKYLVLSGRKKAYIERTDPEFMEAFKNHYEKYEQVNDLLEVKDDIYLKLTICDLSGAEENSYPYVSPYKDRLQVKLSGKIWIDFNHLEAHKGNALQAFQKTHGINQENTMAFGDYLNDIELFDHAAISYAVENAHPKVREAAKFRTKSNNENGVEAILRHLL